MKLHELEKDLKREKESQPKKGSTIIDISSPRDRKHHSILVDDATGEVSRVWMDDYCNVHHVCDNCWD